jgi:hypothetical protein
MIITFLRQGLITLKNSTRIPLTSATQIQHVFLAELYGANAQRRIFRLFYAILSNENHFFKAKKNPNSQLSERGFLKYIL